MAAKQLLKKDKAIDISIIEEYIASRCVSITGGNLKDT